MCIDCFGQLAVMSLCLRQCWVGIVKIACKRFMLLSKHNNRLHSRYQLILLVDCPIGVYQVTKWPSQDNSKREGSLFFNS